MPTTPAQLSEWAERILESIDETGIGAARTVTWLQHNLYRLNSALSTGFYLESGNIYPDMPQGVSGIYEEMYYCDYLNKKANAALGVHSYDWTEISGDEQGTIRRVSKNEVAKTYRTMSKDCQERLDKLVKWYLGTLTDIVFAGQVLYGDRGTVADFGLINFHAPPTEYYSNNNTVWLDDDTS